MLGNTIYTEKFFTLCAGDRHERHARCREVPGLLWQLSSPDDSWTYTPCRDFLHTRTRARLPWGSDPHRHPDTHVWGRRGWLPSLPHWTRGKQLVDSGFFIMAALFFLLNTQTEILIFPSGNWWGLQTDQAWGRWPRTWGWRHQNHSTVFHIATPAAATDLWAASSKKAQWCNRKKGML